MSASRCARSLLVLCLLAAGSQAAVAADVRVTGVELRYFARAAGGGWAPADSPARGAMVAIRCDYTVSYDDGERPGDWSLAFTLDGQELDDVAGAGLVDPSTGRSSRTWYGTMIRGGTHEVGCVADARNELAETDEANNRAVSPLAIPGRTPQTTRGAAPSAADERGTPALARATATQAAQVRGRAPAVDLHFTPAAGIKRVSGRAADGSVTAAAVGEELIVDCNYRAALDAPNGEPVNVAPYGVAIERDGTPVATADGIRNLVSVRGASRAGLATERWRPTAAGRYVVRCRLDPAGALAETDESNNTLELAIDVGAAGMRAAAAAPVPGAAAGPSVSAQLAFVAHDPSSLAPVLGPTQGTVYRSLPKVQLTFASQESGQVEWRWQAALWPFPADPGLEPQALLAQGAVAGQVFSVDLTAFPPLGAAPAPTSATLGNAPASTGNVAIVPPAAPSSAAGGRAGVHNPAARTLPPAAPRATAPRSAAVTQAQAGGAPATAAPVPSIAAPDVPLDIYIRIVPYANGAIAAPPSNFVVAHYLPGENPAQAGIEQGLANVANQEEKLAEMTAAANVFVLDVLAMERAFLYDVNRWGCVEVIANPHAATPLHLLNGYGPGLHCPKNDPQFMEKSWDEKALEAIGGWGHAWDGLVWAYEQAKDFVATQFAQAVPCSLLEEVVEGSEDDCYAAAKKVADAAITAGLMAAGVPPTLPDLEGLGALAKGEAVEAGVAYTCELIEDAGEKCTPEMREGLTELYEAGLNELQKAAKQQAGEPGCGDAQTAAQLGKLPLPCFSAYPGTVVVPAPGAVESSPQMTLRVTRKQADPDFPMSCSVTASFLLQNDIAGFGPVTRALWAPVTASMPALGVGQSTVIELELGPKTFLEVLGQDADTYSWYELLSGARGTLSAVTATHHKVAPGQAGPVQVSCSNLVSATFQLPKNVNVQEPWVKL